MTELDAASARKLDTFVQGIHGQRRELDALKRASSGRSESQRARDGLPVTVTDIDGHVIERIEPALVVVEPEVTPPTPEAPEVEALAGVAVVALSGLDLAEELAPMSVVGTRVHASLETGFTPSAGSLRIASAPVTGEVVLPVTAGVWHVRIEWVTRTGTVSAPSAEVVVDLEPLVDTDDIAATLQTARDELAVVSAQAEADLATLDRMLSERIDTETGKPLTLDRLQPGDAAIEVLDSLYSQLAVVNRLTALTAWIGGTMIGEGQIVADHIVASERMSAKLGEFLRVRAGQIEANAFEGQSFTGGIFTGPVIQSHAAPGRGMKLTASGLQFFQAHEEGDGSMTAHPSLTMGVDGDLALSSVDPATGETRWQVGQTGDASFESVSSNQDLTVMGSPLVGGLVAHPASDYSLSILDQIGWGDVGRPGRRTTHTSGPYAPGEHGLYQYNVTALPGREYEVYADFGHLLRNGDSIVGRIRFTNDGSEPNLSSPILDHAVMGGATGTWDGMRLITRFNGPSAEGAAPQNVRLLMTLFSGTAFSFVSGGNPAYRALYIRVRDAGPIRSVPGYDRNVRLLTGTSGGGTDDTPPPAVSRRTSVWQAASFAAYFNNGYTRLTRGTGLTMMKQGYDPDWPQGGRQSSYFRLGQNATSGSDVGRTRSAALNGAALVSGTLTIQGQYAPRVAGVSQQRMVHVYAHGVPGSLDSWTGSNTYVGGRSIAPGQKRHFPLSASVMEQLRTGAIDAFGFFTTSTYIGDATAISWQERYRPTVTITYER